MNITHILIDDSNPLHRELPIYRTGTVGKVRLADGEYRVYASIGISAHDMAAIFHYGVIEALNALPFISEANHGLDSWDEAFLPSGQIPEMIAVVRTYIGNISDREPENVLLGWQDDPARIAYWRTIDPVKAADFLGMLAEFATEAASEGFDLEFIL